MIAGADTRVRSAFRAALRRQPYFGAPPREPVVLCVEDLTPAIARAEAVLKKSIATPPPPPPVVVFDGDKAGGSQRIAALTAREAERVLHTDSILVLDEYAFKYPAGRLDHFLAFLGDVPAPRPAVSKRALVGRLALALLAPVLLMAVFAAGMGVGHAESRRTDTAGNVARALPTAPSASAAPAKLDR